MSALAEACRAAGNVLLRPVELSDALDPAVTGRALLAGSRDDRMISKAARRLGEAAPGLDLDICGQGGVAPRGVWSLRRRGYDVVCLLLTGEGLSREKIAAALARAPTTLAYGSDGRWRRIRVPAVRPLSVQWWARLILAGLLCLAQCRIITAMLAVDTLRKVFPADRPPADPGAPGGRRVTFIVPAYNHRHLMDFCLPPLLAEAGDEHRVVVVDDASTDGTADYVRERYPGARLVALTKNRGFAGAVMAGIAASDTPLFALINSDVAVRPGFLAAMLPPFDRPDTFAVCSRIDLPDGSRMETGNVAAEFSGILEPHHVAPVAPGAILYAGGASSVFHRLRYEALGGFDTIYHPFYWEDIDLGYRAWRRGWQSRFEPAASVLHQRRATIGTSYGDAYANETFLKNALLFVWKNVRDRRLLARHAGYVCARLVSEILDGEGTMCRALLRTLPLANWTLVKRGRAYRRGDVGDCEILASAQPSAAAGAPEIGGL